jgi:hypothetical protein
MIDAHEQTDNMTIDCNNSNKYKHEKSAGRILPNVIIIVVVRTTTMGSFVSSFLRRAGLTPSS